MEGPFYIKRGTDFAQVPVIDVTCCFQAGMLILEEKKGLF